VLSCMHKVNSNVQWHPVFIKRPTVFTQDRAIQHVDVSLGACLCTYVEILHMALQHVLQCAQCQAAAVQIIFAGSIHCPDLQRASQLMCA
jgi:hypothetical protein